MRIIVCILISALIVFSFTAMASADNRYYFYKEANKQLKRAARYDSYFFPEVRNKFPGVSITFNLPERRSKKSGKITTGISFIAQSTEKYYFSIDSFQMRNGENKYPLQKHSGNITPSHPQYDQITAYESVGGKVRTKYDIEVDGSDRIRKFLAPSFHFSASPLPKKLYLDYKFRIRKENGPEETFEGTIPLELTSYYIGLWEKMWR